MCDSACLRDVNNDINGHMHARTRRAPPAVVASLFLAFACSAPAAADELTYNADGLPAATIATSLPDNGDPGGFRKSMAERGVTYNFLYTNDILANIRGGEKRGTIDEGKLEASIAIDLGKLAGFNGLQFYSNAFAIHNTGRIRRDYISGINTISSIEATPATRLSEIWLEQKFWDDRASLRFGQLTADTEFFGSGLNALFLQGGWPTIVAANTPSGGPTYPLSTPGIRLKVDPSEQVTMLLAMFNGDPAGPGPGDEQIRNRHGLNFRIADPPLVIAEVQHRTNQGKGDTGLARTLKLGGWTHFGTFEDRRFADDGSLLADPAGSGEAARRHGNWGFYGVIEQQLYRPKGGEADSGISLFARLSVSPSDRNDIGLFADGGFVFSGMIAGRPDDKFGASIMYAQFSDGVRAFARDQIAWTGNPSVVQDYEMNLELTYVAQVIPGWTVQPLLTYVWHPNGESGRDAMVVGLRSNWRY